MQIASFSSLLNALFSLDAVYAITGVILWVFALMTFADRDNRRRIGSGIFWLILGAVFAFGSLLPHWATGLLILLMVAIEGAGRVSRGNYNEATKERQLSEARRLGDKIFLPVLAIPLVTFGFAVLAPALGLFGGDMSRGALVGLGFGGLAAMWVALRLTGGSVKVMMNEGRRLNDAIGALSILPQLLASLGVIFAAAKVGELVASGIIKIVSPDNLFLLVLANCLGMALFTLVMGNSFAAFPVITAGVLVPLIIEPFHVNPAMAGILTLTAGASGTLMTPRAANFNIVPTALLNMRDQFGVIKFQLPFALIMWSLHIVLMWLMIKLF
jgi:uncharacterized membrane protein